MLGLSYLILGGWGGGESINIQQSGFMYQIFEGGFVMFPCGWDRFAMLCANLCALLCPPSLPWLCRAAEQALAQQTSEVRSKGQAEARLQVCVRVRVLHVCM